MTTAAPQGIEIASAKKFCDFTAHEVSPAAILHENFGIFNFATALVSKKIWCPRIFPELRGPNQNHHRISLTDLTGGYRKRLLGSRARNQNVTKMPENYVHQIFASRPRRLKYYLDGGYLNRLYKSCAIRNDHGGAARH